MYKYKKKYSFYDLGFELKENLCLIDQLTLESMDSPVCVIFIQAQSFTTSILTKVNGPTNIPFRSNNN